MRFLTYRSRYPYWSSSKLSVWLRNKFKIVNPQWASMEEWDNHDDYCKKTAPIIHWITDTLFNKLQDIWLFIPDVIYTIKVATIWKYFRNLYVFHKALWNYRSWDYSGLLRLMETATKDMHECHRDHGHLMRSEQTAKELLIVSTLCKRIREDKYTDEVQGFKSKEGSFFGGEFYQKANTLPSIKYKRFYKMRENVKKNDLELLTKLMKTKLLSWWD